MTDSEPTPVKRLVDARAVCQILGCGPTHLWKLANEGLITPVRLSARMTRYDTAEANALADSLIADAKAKSAERMQKRMSAPARSAA